MADNQTSGWGGFTPEQQRAVDNLYHRDADGATDLPAFRARFHKDFLMDCVVGSWCGMFMGIEKDGYAHS